MAEEKGSMRLQNMARAYKHADFYMDESILGGSGETRTISQTCDYLSSAGFVDIKVSEFARDILTMITADKPK